MLPRVPLAAHATIVGDVAESREARATPVNSGHGSRPGYVFGDHISATVNSLENVQGVGNEFQAVREIAMDHQVPPYGYDPTTPGPNFDQQTLPQLNWLSPPPQASFDWDFLEEIPVSFPDVLPEPGGFALASEVEQGNKPIGLVPRTAEPTTIRDCIMSPASERTSSSRGMPSTNSTATCGIIGRNPHASSPGSSTGTYYVDGTGARAPFKGRQVTNRRSRITLASLTNDESQVDAMDQSGHTPSSALSSECVSIYHTLIEGLSSQGLNSATCPPPAYIDICIKLYFERFHPIFPFIRRAEVGNGGQPWFLLLAIAATGARYTQGPGLVPHRDALFDSLQQALDHEFYLSLLGLPEGGWTCLPTPARSSNERLPDMQAGLLHVLIMLHSGKQALVKRAISARYYLVETCNRLQLLSKPETGSRSARCDDMDLQSWITQQSRLRVGFMIFVSHDICYTLILRPANVFEILDFMFVYELNLNGLMRLSDANGLLPCHEEAWETPSTENVSSARSSSGTCSVCLLAREPQVRSIRVNANQRISHSPRGFRDAIHGKETTA